MDGRSPFTRTGTPPTKRRNWGFSNSCDIRLQNPRWQWPGFVTHIGRRERCARKTIESHLHSQFSLCKKKLLFPFTPYTNKSCNTHRRGVDKLTNFYTYEKFNHEESMLHNSSIILNTVNCLSLLKLTKACQDLQVPQSVNTAAPPWKIILLYFLLIYISLTYIHI